MAGLVSTFTIFVIELIIVCGDISSLNSAVERQVMISFNVAVTVLPVAVHFAHYMCGPDCNTKCSTFWTRIYGPFRVLNGIAVAVLLCLLCKLERSADHTEGALDGGIGSFESVDLMINYFMNAYMIGMLYPMLTRTIFTYKSETSTEFDDSMAEEIPTDGDETSNVPLTKPSKKRKKKYSRPVDV
jgi:hypothetical protein